MSDKESASKLPIDNKTDKRKQSLYFPESMLQEIKEEAARLDRSLSWIVQRAWKIARTEIKKLPSVNDVEGGEDDDTGE
ncbi:MAG: TIGR04563 family protein [Polyangiaceae bacterium]|nr:TIGR04563 family protein [Polyangiaceae bacterium]